MVWIRRQGVTDHRRGASLYRLVQGEGVVNLDRVGRIILNGGGRTVEHLFNRGASGIEEHGSAAGNAGAAIARHVKSREHCGSCAGGRGRLQDEAAQITEIRGGICVERHTDRVAVRGSQAEERHALQALTHLQNDVHDAGGDLARGGIVIAVRSVGNCRHGRGAIGNRVLLLGNDPLQAGGIYRRDKVIIIPVGGEEVIRELEVGDQRGIDLGPLGGIRERDVGAIDIKTNGHARGKRAPGELDRARRQRRHMKSGGRAGYVVVESHDQRIGPGAFPSPVRRRGLDGIVATQLNHSLVGAIS